LYKGELRVYAVRQGRNKVRIIQYLVTGKGEPSYIDIKHPVVELKGDKFGTEDCGFTDKDKGMKVIKKCFRLLAEHKFLSLVH
jgi:hypothetical protein